MRGAEYTAGMSLETMLTQRCTIKRPTFTQTDGQDVPGTPTTVATDVRCRFEEGLAQRMRMKIGEMIEHDGIVFFKIDQDVQPQTGDNNGGDTIEMTSPARIAGTKLTVQFVADESGMSHHLVALVKRHGTAT